MIRHLECQNDEALLRALGLGRRQILHHSGSGRVAGYLEHKANGPCYAMVDEDPQGSVPRYFNNFKTIGERDGLLLKKFERREQILVVVKPDLEPWLLTWGKKSGVSPEEFQLPGERSRLHSLPKNRLDRFEEWIEAMVKSRASGLMRLKDWLGID